MDAGGGSDLEVLWTFIREAVWTAIRARRGGVSASPLAFWPRSAIVRDSRVPRDFPLYRHRFQLRLLLQNEVQIRFQIQIQTQIQVLRQVQA